MLISDRSILNNIDSAGPCRLIVRLNESLDIMKTHLHQTQILRDISKNPGLSQRELALKNGISLGKVNYAIRALIDKGHIKMKNFQNAKNKRKYMYVLTPEGMAAKANQTYGFLKWKMEEYDRLKKEIEELENDTQVQL